MYWYTVLYLSLQYAKLRNEWRMCNEHIWRTHIKEKETEAAEWDMYYLQKYETNLSFILQLNKISSSPRHSLDRLQDETTAPRLIMEFWDGSHPSASRRRHNLFPDMGGGGRGRWYIHNTPALSLPLAQDKQNSPQCEGGGTESP
jgi:hypothetical protein